MSQFGTVEMGGTKVDVAVGTHPGDLSDRHRITTGEPEPTLAAVIDWLTGEDVVAVGVASFGPLDLAPDSRRFGTMLATPKPGWTGTPIYQILHEGLAVPISLDTDVNGAALGEGRWGAAQKMDNFVYLTVGTGIGGGVVVDGQPLSGERHPEVGHIPIRRIDSDTYEGRCPYHGDCLEGLASGPALEARFGNPATWAGDESIVGLAAHYVAQGVQTLFYTVAPERVIIGGGVASLPWFHDRVRSKLETFIAGYPVEPDVDLLVSKPGLGDLSGLAGGLVLAEQAAY